jgi:hypothetical protein
MSSPLVVNATMTLDYRNPSFTSATPEPAPDAALSRLLEKLLSLEDSENVRPQKLRKGADAIRQSQETDVVHKGDKVQRLVDMLTGLLEKDGSANGDEKEREISRQVEKGAGPERIVAKPYDGRIIDTRTKGYEIPVAFYNPARDAPTTTHKPNCDDTDTSKSSPKIKRDDNADQISSDSRTSRNCEVEKSVLPSDRTTSCKDGQIPISPIPPHEAEAPSRENDESIATANDASETVYIELSVEADKTAKSDPPENASSIETAEVETRKDNTSTIEKDPSVAINVDMSLEEATGPANSSGDTTAAVPVDLDVHHPVTSSIAVPVPPLQDNPEPPRVHHPLTHQTLQQLLNDTPGYSPPPRPPPKDDHGTSDDAASINTRNEYWSISSFHTRTPPTGDSDKASIAETNPPLPDEAPDFPLPLDSLLKPMKKSTFTPVPQKVMEEFLERAKWKHTAPTSETHGTTGHWTAKKLPLQPVDFSGEKRVVTRDPFLESIAGRGGEGRMMRGRRSRLNQYPGRETTYTEFMKEEENRNLGIYELEYMYVKRISTQSTNPPDWYLRQRRESTKGVREEEVKGEEVKTQEVKTEETKKPEVAVVPEPVVEPSPPTHKVSPE